jgi:anti-sigma factor RsiW
MKGEHHERAKQLMDVSAVEGISGADQTWLDTHLESCPGCAAYEESVRRTISTLRAVSVALDPTVVEATRLRVRLRAHELREQQSRMRVLWTVCGLSWAMGVASAPLLWWGLEWIGERFAMPWPVWLVAFAFSWIVPAVVVAAVLVWRRAMRAAQNGQAAVEL